MTCRFCGSDGRGPMMPLIAIDARRPVGRRATGHGPGCCAGRGLTTPGRPPGGYVPVRRGEARGVDLGGDEAESLALGVRADAGPGGACMISLGGGATTPIGVVAGGPW